MARIGHLVVVAGPQAAGKSTFIKHWRDGTLNQDVAAALPEAADWPDFNHKKVQRFVANPASRLPGVIIQYDVMRRLELPSIECDDILKMVAMAKEVTMVVLELPTGQLLHRLLGRYVRRSVGQDDRVPVGRFDIGLRALAARSRNATADGAAPLAWRLLAPRWKEVVASMRPWVATVHNHYAQDPDLPGMLVAECVDAVSRHATGPVTLIPIGPTPYLRRSRIGWMIKPQGVNAVSAGGETAEGHDIARRLPAARDASPFP